MNDNEHAAVVFDGIMTMIIDGMKITVPVTSRGEALATLPIDSEPLLK